MLLRILTVHLVTLTALRAQADTSELQFSARPELVLLHRDGDLNHGLGVSARGAYGLNDLVALEATLACDRLTGITNATTVIDHRSGSLVYDATRCTLGPAVALRFGAQVIGSVAAGLAYRWERNSSRDFVSTNKVLLRTLGNTDDHAMLATLRASLELRPWDLLAFGVDLGLREALLGDPTELDVSLGLVLSLFMYP